MPARRKPAEILSRPLYLLLKGMPRTNTEAFRKRHEKALAQARRLEALLAQWRESLEQGPNYDPERDDFLDKMSAIVDGHSPNDRSQMTIVRAVILARQRRVSDVRKWVGSFGIDALNEVADEIIEAAVSKKPKTPKSRWPVQCTAGDVALLELLIAAGVSERGRSFSRDDL